MTITRESDSSSYAGYYTIEEALERWPELEQATRALVKIYGYETGQFGSGVITPKYVLTAKHVLDEADGKIDIEDGRTRLNLDGYKSRQTPKTISEGIAAILGDSADFAAIPLPDSLSNHPSIEISYKTINPGDEVFNIGHISHPKFGLYGDSLIIVIPGKVNHVSRNCIGVTQSARVNTHGMSGGPLIKGGLLIGTYMDYNDLSLHYNASLVKMKERGLLS